MCHCNDGRGRENRKTDECKRADNLINDSLFKATGVAPKSLLNLLFIHP
jgi:hypothetical protein